MANQNFNQLIQLTLKSWDFYVTSISAHTTYENGFIYHSQAKVSRSKTAESWIFWIYFDTGYSQKVKKNLKGE